MIAFAVDLFCLFPQHMHVFVNIACTDESVTSPKKSTNKEGKLWLSQICPLCVSIFNGDHSKDSKLQEVLTQR